MKIDRHNYEEYFLLYVDNELSVDQKKQVELFVKENPDLEEELVMLQRSRLIPDDKIVFNEKHLLMREENNSFINVSNYEEWLVLYVDDELNEKEKLAVEKFVAAHPHVQKELAIFQQTKLQPEKIAFDKKVLYRSEKPRVISIEWWKVAVAAVLILAAGATTYSVLHKKSNGPAEKVASVKKEQAPNVAKETPLDRQQNFIPNNEQKEAVVIPESGGKKHKQKQGFKNETKKLPLASSLQQTALRTNREKHVIINETNVTKIEEPAIKNVTAINDKLPKQIFNDTTVTKNPRQTPEPMYASNTENKKLRGFFRKATRLIERATNINPADDDNRVLIGGMAINLK